MVIWGISVKYTFAKMADIVAKFLEAKKVGRYSVYLMDYGAPIGYRVFAKGPDFHEQLAEAVSRVNKDLAVAERVRRFVVVGDLFSVENGMMTPSMKRSAATSS